MNIKIKEKIDSFQRVLITGGGGFIGGCLVRTLLKNTSTTIFNFDKMGYASDCTGINNIIEHSKHNDDNFLSNRYTFFRGDLNDQGQLREAFDIAKPNLIFNLAAESHVDRSIDSPKSFIESNIIGTYNLLEIIRENNRNLSNSSKPAKLIHISTDEVFGSIKAPLKFQEISPYDPRSPYSASKASSDHLVSAWFHTYGVETIVTNCSNNYGPWQFPEKLIPLVILKALNNEVIPIYGDGKNVRDWIFVGDHVKGLLYSAAFGSGGDKYCIGSSNEIENIDLVNRICSKLDKLKPGKQKYSNLIKFVKDRSGHDRRYSIDSSLIMNKLGWSPEMNINEGLDLTIKWYLSNLGWCKKVSNQSSYHGDRLGVSNLN